MRRLRVDADPEKGEAVREGVMRLVGFAGRAGSGKTLAAALMAIELIGDGYPVKLDAFAVPIKRRVREEERRDHIDKKADRAFMQRYGAAMRGGDPALFIKDLIRRNNMDSHLWGHFADHWEPADFLIIDDVRYPNEAEFICRRGVLVFVDGSHAPLSGEEAAHESESHMETLRGMADAIIMPGLSFEQLRQFIHNLVRTRGHLQYVAPPSQSDQ